MMGALRKSFVDPFSNPKLGALFLSLAAGKFAFSFIGTYLAIDMLRLGFEGIVAYLGMWLIPAGFIGFPFFFFLSRRYGFSRAQMAIVIMQFAGMAMVLFIPGLTVQPYLVGLTLFLMATGYWQMVHICLAAHASDGARGYEIGLAKSIAEVATVIGAAAAGFALAYDAGATLSASFILVAFATFGLIYSTPEQVEGDTAGQGSISFEGLFSAIKRYPGQNIATALEAAFEMHISFLRTTWLAALGVAATAIGIIGGLQALWTTMLVPLIGRFIHDNKGTEFRAASVAGFVSWVPMLLGTAGVWVSSFFWAAAVSFFRCGLESRWYQDRSATQILMREIMLTIVRIPCIPLFAWVILNAPEYYPYIGMGIACLLWPVGLRILRKPQ